MSNKITTINFWILLLVLFVYLIITRVNFFYKIRLNLLFILLYQIFIITSFLSFYILYEIVFIFIIFTIILLGYRYERLIALYLIIFYSFLFSRPVIIIFILFDYVFLIQNWLMYSYFFNILLIISFVVKFPIFGFHYWLPIAHVEASTVGSILLAGILLKLGCVGVLYVIRYLKFIIKFHWLSLGTVLVILIILLLRDLKIIIAYSSIAHIRLIFYVLILGWRVGKQGAIIIILYHGFISPLIFWLVGLLVWYKTRSLLVTKFLIFSYFFIFYIFFLIILNIGFPPFIGFLREILIFKSLIIVKSTLAIFIITILFRCYYNIYLFWCFKGIIGWVFKLNFSNIEPFIFIFFCLFLNF
jgi:NADH:ubiquinone oxidoreductase subunit 4 (subunit M)